MQVQPNILQLVGQACFCEGGEVMQWPAIRAAPLQRYGMAVALVAVSCVLRWTLPEVLTGTYLPFYPAVAAAAMLGGFGPGMLATILSLVSSDILFDNTPGHLDLGDPLSLSRGAMFVFGAMVASLTAQWLRSQHIRQIRLGEALARLGITVEASDDAILSTDADGIIQSWNDGAQRMLGYEAKEIIGRPVTVLLPPDRLHEEQQIMAALRAGKRIEHLETVRFARDGRPVDVWATVSPLTDARGRVSGAAKILRDITEHKAVQQALEQSEQRFRTLVTASSEVLYRMSPDWSEMRWLRGGGFIRDTETPSRTWIHDYIYADDQPRILATIDQAIRARSSFELEHRVVRVDGSIGWMLSHAVPLLDGNGEIVEWFGAASNITRRKQDEEGLAAAKLSAEKAKAVAEEANHAKDHFLAVLSHELRTPLTAVVPALTILEPMLSGEGKALLEMAQRNVEMETRLIDDLLDMTRITQGKIDLDRRSVDLCTILRHALEVCQPDIAARRQHFQLEIKHPPHLVHADAGRLQQVFWNLIKNAVKFTPHDGCVGVRAYRHDGLVVVEVSDSGVGIEPEALGRIFNAFEQGERTTTRQFGGLGLGLSISKALVDLHGGTITAYSDGKGKGATFAVTLPLLTRADGTTTSNPKPATGAAIRPLRILLVEDHSDTARIMRRLLQSWGNHVEHATDVATALQLAAAQPFDLLLSDLGLPDGSGLDLMRMLRAQGLARPGIALSGYGQEADIQASRAAGFALHLVKPVTMPRLADAIASVVADFDQDPPNSLSLTP